MNVTRSRSAALSLCLALAGSAALAAEDPFIGTWVLNAAKSQFPPGAQPDSTTIVVSDAGDGMLKSVSDTSTGGLTIHGEVTFAVDGKDYTPVSTPPPPPGATVTQSSERIGERAYKTSIKMNGEVAVTMLSEVSVDGKTLTISSASAGAATGVTSVMVLDRK